MSRKNITALVVAAVGVLILGFAEDYKDLVIGAMTLTIAGMYAE